MKLFKFAPLAFIISIALVISSCSKFSNPVSTISESDKAEIQKLLENDDLIASTIPSLNDETSLPPDYDMGTQEKAIYPLRWGRVIQEVTKKFEYEKVNDTLVVVTIKRTVKSNFLILATYTKGSFKPDTLIVKPVVETFTRKVKVVKNRFGKWRIWAVSLVQGGTENENIKIQKIEIIFPNGNTVEITDPLNQFFRPGFFALRHGMIRFTPARMVKFRVTIESVSPDTDFVGLTFGVDRFRRHRIRRALRPVEINGNIKVYERTVRVHLHRGSFNAFIHAATRESLFDDAEPVSVVVWGVPYVVF